MIEALLICSSLEHMNRPLHHDGRRNWSSKQAFPWQAACCLGGTFLFSLTVPINVMFQSSSKEKADGRGIATTLQGLN